MSDQPPSYTIRDLNDLLAIPLDRMDEFFEDFVRHTKEIKKQHDAVKRLYPDSSTQMLLKEVVWIDDGDTSSTTVVNIGE